MEGTYKSYEERLAQRFAEEIDWKGVGAQIAEDHYQELTLTAGDHETPEVDLILVAIDYFLQLQEDVQREIIEQWEAKR